MALMALMYTRCHLCDRDLGRNAVLEHLPVGRRIAFDPARGRLWVVCVACGEWNLTPFETRWEAVEECERRFPAAAARVSTGEIGLARIDRALELIRVGAALRNELANWRYAARLRRRRRRVLLRGSAVALVGAGAVGALTAASGTVVGALWASVVPLWWAAHLATPSPMRAVIEATDHAGARVTLRRGHFAGVELRRGGRSRQLELRLLGLGGEHRFGATAVGPVLTRAMPHVNWLGASAEDLAVACTLVETAESAVAVARAQPGRARVGDAVWERLLEETLAEGERDVSRWDGPRRFALEMALTEAAEERALTEEARRLEPRSETAAEVATIADGLTWSDALAAQLDALRARRRP